MTTKKNTHQHRETAIEQSPDLTRLINAVDLPGLIAERFPDSGARPNTVGPVKAVWRDERNASASVFRSDGGDGWLFKDHGTEQVGNAFHFLTAVCGLSKDDTIEEIERLANGEASRQSGMGNRISNDKRKITATYDFVDKEGNLLYQEVRYDPKGFTQRRPDGHGGWIYNLKGARRVLYRLPRIIEGIEQNKLIYLVEGPKDVNTLEQLGRVATTNAMGAGKWEDGYTETLSGADVVIIPDHDIKGFNHARKIAVALSEKARHITIVRLPDLDDGGDISDWLAAGHTGQELTRLVVTSSKWQPGDDLEAFLNTALEDPWDGLLDLPTITPVVPTMPSELLPEPLRPWIDDAAERACVHREFIAIPAVVALSSVIGRSVGIYPKEKDDWLVVPNLWGAIIGPPSSFKSPSIREGLKPLSRLAAIAQQDAAEEQEARQADIDLIKGAIEQLKRQSKGKKPDKVRIRAELADKYKELEETQFKERRFLTQDATVEKLAQLLKDNPRGLLLSRDELIGWLRTMDKPGHESDRAFFLESWNGLGGYTVDRIGRGTLHVPALTLSIVGGIQPGRLMPYLLAAFDGTTENDGLLQRFQLLVWPDQLPSWRRVDRYPDDDAKAQAFVIYEYLDQLEPTALGAKVDESNPNAIPALRFDDEAREMFNSWLDEHMNRLRSAGLERTPAFQAHLAKYPSLVASLALIFHLVNVASGEESGPVSAKALDLALIWIVFLELHAQKTYALEVNADTQAAHKLFEHIEAGQVKDGTPLRDLYHRGWEGLKTLEQVSLAVRILEKTNRVRLETKASGKHGGRPSTIIRLHPELRP